MKLLENIKLNLRAGYPSREYKKIFDYFLGMAVQFSGLEVGKTKSACPVGRVFVSERPSGVSAMHLEEGRMNLNNGKNLFHQLKEKGYDLDKSQKIISEINNCACLEHLIKKSTRENSNEIQLAEIGSFHNLHLTKNGLIEYYRGSMCKMDSYVSVNGKLKYDSGFPIGNSYGKKQITPSNTIFFDAGNLAFLFARFVAKASHEKSPYKTPPEIRLYGPIVQNTSEIIKKSETIFS